MHTHTHTVRDILLSFLFIILLKLIVGVMTINEINSTRYGKNEINNFIFVALDLYLVHFDCAVWKCLYIQRKLFSNLIFYYTSKRIIYYFCLVFILLFISKSDVYTYFDMYIHLCGDENIIKFSVTRKKKIETAGRRLNITYY